MKQHLLVKHLQTIFLKPSMVYLMIFLIMVNFSVSVLENIYLKQEKQEVSTIINLMILSQNGFKEETYWQEMILMTSLV